MPFSALQEKQEKSKTFLKPWASASAQPNQTQTLDFDPNLNPDFGTPSEVEP